MKEVDESVKFAWAYLLTYGKLTSGEWSYYGSGWEGLEKYKGTYGKKWEAQYKEFEEVSAKAVSIGVDWDKTEIPEVGTYSGFAGTFAETQDKCLGTLGKLVLKNGEKFLIGSSDDDAAHLVETARQLLRGKDSPIMELAGKL